MSHKPEKNDTFSKKSERVKKHADTKLSRKTTPKRLKHSTRKYSPRKHHTRKHSTRKHSTRKHSTRKHSTRKRTTRKHSTKKRTTRKHSTRKRTTRKHSTRKHSTKKRKQKGGDEDGDEIPRHELTKDAKDLHFLLLQKCQERINKAKQMCNDNRNLITKFRCNRMVKDFIKRIIRFSEDAAQTVKEDIANCESEKECKQKYTETLNVVGSRCQDLEESVNLMGKIKEIDKIQKGKEFQAQTFTDEEYKALMKPVVKGWIDLCDRTPTLEKLFQTEAFTCLNVRDMRKNNMNDDEILEKALDLQIQYLPNPK
jgi:hypothetical protein